MLLRLCLQLRLKAKKLEYAAIDLALGGHPSFSMINIFTMDSWVLARPTLHIDKHEYIKNVKLERLFSYPFLFIYIFLFGIVNAFAGYVSWGLSISLV